MKASLSIATCFTIAFMLSGCVYAYHPDCVATAEGVYCPQPIAYCQWAPVADGYHTCGGPYYPVHRYWVSGHYYCGHWVKGHWAYVRA